MSEWKETTLGKISKSIQYGYTESASDNPTDPKFLRITDIQEDFINWDTVPHCPINEDDFFKYKLEIGDICIARTGNSTGAVGFIKDDIKAVFASYLIRYKIDCSLAVPQFINFLLKSLHWKKFVNSIKSGSAQAGANAKSFAEFPIHLPSLTEQKRIADVLSCFDAKIENLRRQNETLEQIAQTLFNHWFIDFEFPNADGKSYKSSGGAMSPSELGDIPEGWRVGQICDLVNHVKDSLNPSKSPNTFFLHYSLPAFDVNKEPIKELGTDIKSNKYQVYSNVILVSKLNPDTPRIWEILDLTYDFCICSTEFQILKPKKKIYFEYCIQILNLRKNIISLGTMASGTSGSHRRVKPSDILDIDCVIPDENSFVQVNKVLEPLLKKQHQNKKQIKTLTKTRDALLPKLMSGQLRVKE